MYPGYDTLDPSRNVNPPGSWLTFDTPTRRGPNLNLTEIGSGLLGRVSQTLRNLQTAGMPGGDPVSNWMETASGGNMSGPFSSSSVAAANEAAAAARGRSLQSSISAGVPSTADWATQRAGLFGDTLGRTITPQGLTPDVLAGRISPGVRRPEDMLAATSLQDLKQQWFQERERTINDAVAAVNAQYAGPLDELRQRLADFQIGDREIQAAYANYQADIEDIGVGVGPAEGLIDTDVVSAVEDNYHGAEGSLGEAFAKIDSDGNPGMSEALAEELRTFETVIEDSLRTDLASMDDLHALSSQYAEALAGFAYADDKYRADQERTLVKAQMDKAIKDQKDAIAETEKQMAEAAARARESVMDQYGEFSVDMQTMQAEAFRQYGLQQGMSEEQIATNWAVINGIMDSHGTTIVTSADFRAYANQYINQNNFDKMQLTPHLQRYIDQAQYLTPPATITEGGRQRPITPEEAEMWNAQEAARRQRAVTTMMNANWNNAVRGKSTTSDVFAAQLAAMGINADPFFQRMWDNPNEFDTMAENTALLDGWKIMQETENNWEQIQSAGNRYFTEDQLSVAPSGYTFPIVGTNWGSGGGYGYVKPSGRTHQGVDIGAYRGTPIVAPADGVIEGKGWSDMSGWYVRLRDKNGNLHKFMHLDQEPTIGGNVRAGTQIGAVGRTGNAAGGGPHLHYEIWNRGGASMDPAPWLKTTGGWQIGDPPSNLTQGY